MTLKFYYHPLSSFCQKALMAFYENDIAFEPVIVDLGGEPSRSEFLKMWPLGKIPVLRDEARDWTIPEATMIIEYLNDRFLGKTKLIPADPDIARQVRFRDRFFDLYVNVPMQKIVTDRLRPPGNKDAFGVEEAMRTLKTAVGMVELEMANRPWAMGEIFTMADCAAAPALFYANAVMPFGESYKNAAAYLKRLLARPSFARAYAESEPYRKNFPTA